MRLPSPPCMHEARSRVGCTSTIVGPLQGWLLPPSWPSSAAETRSATVNLLGECTCDPSCNGQGSHTWHPHSRRRSMPPFCIPTPIPTSLWPTIVQVAAACSRVTRCFASLSIANVAVCRERRP